jgi:hypothetical protein
LVVKKKKKKRKEGRKEGRKAGRMIFLQKVMEAS